MSTPFSYFFKKFNQISPLEADFTEVLEAIALKPKTLYFYGKMPKNVVKNGKSVRPKTVAIVGSRHNTRYGEEIAYKLAYDLAKHGVVVVSGLAYGIDSISHQAALDAGGCTVAVLGTPIDHIYPRSHKPLAAKIIEQDGAVMSEHAPGAKIFPKVSFLERNRLISGLADAVIIVEAAEHSGTLNTAAHALDQGKEVFVVPGNINNPYSVGCNRLIKQGANPCLSPDDVLDFLFPERLSRPKRNKNTPLPLGDSELETAILQTIVTGVNNGEEIAENLKLAPTDFNQTITLLEIKGRVRSLGANCWAII